MLMCIKQQQRDVWQEVQGDALVRRALSAHRKQKAARWTQRECEAIILGRHETSGWKRRLSDGVVRRVIAESPLPVLLVNHSLVSFV